MLSAKVRRKLESLTTIPSIPTVIASVLNEIENEHYSTKQVAALIEQDQGLTARVLRMANSPFYGLVRTVSTVDQAIFTIGSNVIKEILVSTLMHRIFNKLNTKLFNAQAFWQYSVFCGCASRFIARKLKYRLVSEALVCGLMHDIGILIEADNFRNNFAKVRRLQKEYGLTLSEAEQAVFECTHSDIGAWMAEKWNFPPRIIKALEEHHNPFYIADEKEYNDEFITMPQFNKLQYPLAAIVSMSEWLSYECGFKEWDAEYTQPKYYASNEFVMQLVDDDLLTDEAAMIVIKQYLIGEYENFSAAF
jgi:putative nucleotidyltransferase with HDIG domain